MAEIEYRNRSISQLVSELNNLGEANVVLEPVRLLAIHEQDISNLKRYKNSHGQQFFIVPGNDKKYVYDEIVQNISSLQLRLLAELYLKGFNSSILFSVPKEQSKLTQLLSEIAKMMGDAVCSAVQFNQQQIVDLVSGTQVAEKDIESRLKFYKVRQSSLLVLVDKVARSPEKEGINLIKLRKINGKQPQKNEINLIVLPEAFFNRNLKSNDYLSIFKSQITQIFNYIKLNPKKKYEHFSKLLTKRLPVTNVIASLILEKSCSLVVNWMNEGNPENLSERVTFYQKIRGLSIFLKIQENSQPLVCQLPNQFIPFAASKKQKLPKNRDLKLAKTERTPVSLLLSQDKEKQLQYCRSFERKTHKYSINDYDEQQQLFRSGQQKQIQNEVTYNTPSPFNYHPLKRQKSVQKQMEIKKFDQTVAKKNVQNLKQSEEIAIMKSNHAVEVSQYHQTIQQLNRKILALTHEKGFQELYTLHQRQLMLLELKIKELRTDISNLCNGANEKSYKAMVRKLNEQVKKLESKAAQQKVTSGKLAFLQKQLSQLRNKYEESEVIRKKLTYELQYMTKRLKICDAQIQILNNKEAQLNDTTKRVAADYTNFAFNNSLESKLSANGFEFLKQVEILLSAVKEGNENSKMFLIRKITNVLQDLASSRNIILECNDFLIQLEEHLQQKLGNKQPQIVLDCNKFIRTFLMDNLHIF